MKAASFLPPAHPCHFSLAGLYTAVETSFEIPVSAKHAAISFEKMKPERPSVCSDRELRRKECRLLRRGRNVPPNSASVVLSGSGNSASGTEFVGSAGKEGTAASSSGPGVLNHF